MNREPRTAPFSLAETGDPKWPRRVLIPAVLALAGIGLLAGALGRTAEPQATTSRQAAVRAQEKASREACCEVVGTDNRAALVTARVSATGETFRFKVKDGAILRGLRARQRFDTRPGPEQLKPGRSFSIVLEQPAKARAIKGPRAQVLNRCCQLVASRGSTSASQPTRRRAATKPVTHEGLTMRGNTAIAKEGYAWKKIGSSRAILVSKTGMGVPSRAAGKRTPVAVDCAGECGARGMCWRVIDHTKERVECVNSGCTKCELVVVETDVMDKPTMQTKP